MDRPCGGPKALPVKPLESELTDGDEPRISAISAGKQSPALWGSNLTPNADAAPPTRLEAVKSVAEAATAATVAAVPDELVGKSSTLGHILLGGFSIKGSNVEKVEKLPEEPGGAELASATLDAVAIGP